MRSSPTRGLAFAAILSMCLVAAGCGSSNNSSSTSTAALTKAEFLKKGNAICRKGNQQTNQAAHKAFPKNVNPSQAQKKKFAADTIIPSIQSQINGVKALGAPAGDEAKVNAMVSTAQSALDKAKQNPTVLLSNGPGPFKKSNQLTNAYGLTACGGGS